MQTDERFEVGGSPEATDSKISNKVIVVGEAK